MATPTSTTSSGPFICYVVYRNPKDYPLQHVVRRWAVVGDEFQADVIPHCVGTYEECVASLPKGLECQDRDPNDDWAILEVWVPQWVELIEIVHAPGVPDLRLTIRRAVCSCQQTGEPSCPVHGEAV